MWLFKKRKKNVENGGHQSMSDNMAAKIARAGIKVQTKFAKAMNKIFRNMNNRKLKTCLIVFCISAGGYSIYLVANAIMGSQKKLKNFKIDQVNVPKHFDKAGDEIIPESYVDGESFYKIQSFRNYMDSLKQNNNKLYDSILLARPHLMDSVQVLEEMYYSQKQK